MVISADINPLTAHALMRLGRRRLSPDRIEYVLTHGSVLRRSGVAFIVLRRADIPESDRRSDLAKLEGVVVLIGTGGFIVTAYKAANVRRVYRDIKKKTRYHRPSPDEAAGPSDRPAAELAA